MRTDLGRKVRSANEEIASRLRERFARAGTFVVNLISAPGSGKTSLLEATARRLPRDVSLAAIVGDVETEADAERLRAAGLAARQIETHGSCHLNAKAVEEALGELPPEGVDLLAVENVGNLVCPVSFDLGEDVKVALVSLPEGHDKPLKYPAAFAQAGAFVVTKMDLVPHLDCDVEKLAGDARAINPGLAVFRVSAKTGDGMSGWLDWLCERARAKRRASGAPRGGGG